MIRKFGKKVYKLRNKMGLSIEKFAELADISKSTLREIENYNSTSSTLTVMKIAKVTGVSIDCLLDDNINEDNLVLVDNNFLLKIRKLEIALNKIKKILNEIKC